MKKVLFIDRDGSILIEPPDKQVDSFEKMQFYPGVITSLSKIVRELNFELVMVTNQAGLGTSSLPEGKFYPVHNKVLQILEGEGVVFSEVLIDRSFPAEHSPNRKPGSGLLAHYLNGEYDLENSYVIGDRYTDVELAQNLGCKAILIDTNSHPDAELTTTEWQEIYRHLSFPGRIADVRRKTRETEIWVRLNLDGSGKTDIQTGLGFFDHMLEQIGKHSGCDLTIQVKGDLKVDEHHTIEDSAIALGETFNKALGGKEGIERYGFVIPMDDSLAAVVLDFSGRSWLEWNAEFSREKVGDMPTEMFYHFFKSFADSARCNLHIKATGQNEHHKIEAIFKAVARSIKLAVRRSQEDYQIPSTKGAL
ncbi:bifunctional histidinol-phosphatase/imidazoleglycerol-phosphate dehydratase HisB [Candidatus Saccharibacteria bacterium]|nr:bifunctional histidinol-phosphatase/imidazoleglycerol-phosphate dehydratase HisB [Candidatus Saccharibacteria bacterium]NIW80397.1 bifunctional histidinol-phosphatase/imidazoleglycerol-phosphate dehydratase HisB [Calditrichia bacterium]